MEDLEDDARGCECFLGEVPERGRDAGADKEQGNLGGGGDDVADGDDADDGDDGDGEPQQKMVDVLDIVNVDILDISNDLYTDLFQKDTEIGVTSEQWDESKSTLTMSTVTTDNDSSTYRKFVTDPTYNNKILPLMGFWNKDPIWNQDLNIVEFEITDTSPVESTAAAAVDAAAE